MTPREATPLNRTRWAAIGAAIAITLGGGSLIGVSASSTESTFVPVEPGRILDTRSTTPIGADNAYGTPLRLKVAGADLTDGSRSAGIPTTATAVSGTITATATGGWGFVTAYPCDSTTDTPPAASNVNFTGADQTVANSATIPLSTDGYICLTAYDTTHLLFDVSGYYTPANTAAIDAYTKTETDALLDNKADQDALDAVFESPAFREALLDQAGGLDLEFDLLGQPSFLTLPEVQLNSQGNPVMLAGYVPAGGTLLNLRLQLITCSDRTCAGDPAAITIAEEGAGYATFALTSDDRPVVAYLTADGSKVLRCGDATCSSGNTTIDLGDLDTQFQSISLDSNDLPVMSFVNGSNNVYVATCTTAECSAMSVSLIATNGTYFTSIEIGIDDHPMVAYTDGDADRAVLAICNDPACSTSPVSVVGIDNSVSSSAGIDVAVTSDGRAGVAYIDEDGVVVIAICDSPACGSFDDSLFGMLKQRGDSPSLVFDSNDLAVLALRAEYPNYKIIDANADTVVDHDELGDTSDLSSNFYLQIHRCLDVGCGTVVGESRPAPRISLVGGYVRSAITDDDALFVTYPSYSLNQGLTISTG